jgi:opine dehydrogenase
MIFGTKAEVQVAALPATRTSELLAAWRSLLPMLVPARSVLDTGLGNVGAILHPVITLLSAERITRGESFDFYTEGVTRRVAEMLATADAERLAIARAYRVATPSLQAWIATTYGHHAQTVLESVGGNPAYVGIKAPATLEHRYLLEDVPTGLIPLIALGKAAGLALPTLSALAERARVALGCVRWQRPRTLSSLGLAGLTPGGIRTVVERGLAATPPADNRAASMLIRRLGCGLDTMPRAS